MKHLAIERDSARAILQTYQTVHDTPLKKRTLLRSRLHRHNQHLELEIRQLREKYLALQAELLHRESHLAQVNEQLRSSKHCMNKLQEDFEHAISQLQLSQPSAA